MKKLYHLIIFLLLIVFPTVVYAGSGCCSHHGGQDYCDKDTGRWVCNDGTYSPTCTCGSNKLDGVNTQAKENDNNKNSNNNTLLEFIVGVLFFTPIIISILIFFLMIASAVLPESISNKINIIIEKIIR